MLLSNLNYVIHKFRFTILFFIFIVVLPILGCGKNKEGNKEKFTQYENKWIIIVGSYRTFQDAQYHNKIKDFNAQILLSTYFEGFDPGWFILIKDKFESTEKAKFAAKELKERKVDHYIKFSGDLFNFETKKYRMGKLPNRLFQNVKENCYIYTGYKSPDKTLSISFEEIDPTADVLVLHRNGEDMKIEQVYFQTEKVFWSQDSKKIAFVNTDFYAGSGDLGLIIIDAETMDVIEINLDELTYNQNLGKREMFQMSNLCWLPSGNGVLFTLTVNFLGYSGHPGIDQNRKTALGSDFNRDDPIELGNYAVYLRPNE